MWFLGKGILNLLRHFAYQQNITSNSIINLEQRLSPEVTIIQLSIISQNILLYILLCLKIRRNLISRYCHSFTILQNTHNSTVI